MATQDPSFWTQVFEAIAPKANRVIATVGFIRTFRQGLSGSAIVAAGGGITLTAVGVAQINWVTVMYAVIAVALTALGAGLNAFWNILQNGIPEGYIRGAVKQLELQRTSQMDTGLQEAIVDAAKAVKTSQEKATK